jgi:hypothetical protein
MYCNYYDVGNEFMKKMNLTIMFSMCLFSSYAFGNGSYNNFLIKDIQYSRGADGVQIVYSGGEGNSNPDGCATGGGNSSFLIPLTSSVPEREKAMLSGASMAFAANKKVSVLLSNCLPGIGGNQYPAVWYLFIHQ